MDIKTVCARAARGLREDVKLYLVAVSSLTVAFVCLATALLALANVNELAAHWGQSHRMSVYLRDDAAEADVARLAAALAKTPAIAAATYTSSAEARARFLEDTRAVEGPLRALPSVAFPASIEVTLQRGTAGQELARIAEKVAAQRALVDDVDTYETWFQRVRTLLGAGRALALALGALVLLCVMAVIANTIRLAVANRRDEIEVLKLCGATDAFVRAPFLLEGMLQGALGALLSLIVLFAAFLALRPEVDSSLGPFAGVQLVFLQPVVALGLVLGGTAVGALGSALSVRRYAAV